MDLFKVVTFGNKVFIKMLGYNERVWSERQWDYSFVRIGTYPTNMEQYATDFKTVEAAEQWIKENLPT
jgi:uncharacterized membrane protein